MTWTDPEPWVLAGGSRLRVTTAGPVAGSWRVEVALPVGLLAGAGPWPAVYVLDPFGTFLTTAHTAAVFNSLSLGRLPGVAVVGVGPDTDDLLTLMSQRNRDLTPTEDYPPNMPGAEVLGTGGGPAFLSLLADQIIPEVESRFPLDPADRTLAGWSLGGLFTLFAFLERPDVFHRALAVSPSLWWHGRHLIDAARVSAADLAGRSAYLTAGELETSAGWERSWPPVPADQLELVKSVDMVADAAEFAALLRARGDVAVVDEMLPDTSHATIWPAAVSRGLIALFDPD